jgi:hypothetical protein
MFGTRPKKKTNSCKTVNFRKSYFGLENARRHFFFFSKVGFQMMCHNLM